MLLDPESPKKPGDDTPQKCVVHWLSHVRRAALWPTAFIFGGNVQKPGKFKCYRTLY